MSRYRNSVPSDCRVFIGDLGNNGSRYEIEDVFRYYGPLRDVWVARNPPGFAFVEFEDPRDARDAVRDLDGTFLCGRRVRVEPCYRKDRNSYRSRSRYNRDQSCYECGRTGHFARDCEFNRRRHSRSRSRSPRRRTRSRSRNREARPSSDRNLVPGDVRNNASDRNRCLPHTKSQSRSASISRSRSRSPRRDIRSRSRNRSPSQSSGRNRRARDWSGNACDREQSRGRDKSPSHSASRNRSQSRSTRRRSKSRSTNRSASQSSSRNSIASDSGANGERSQGDDKSRSRSASRSW